MKLRHLFFVLSLSIISACAPTEKFPYPPRFVTVDDVPPTVIAAPIAPDSRAFKKELQAVLRSQRGLSERHIAVLKAEDPVVPEMIVQPVLDSTVTEERFPLLYQHLRYVGSDSWRIGDAAKEYWQSPRPWAVEPKVQAYVNRLSSSGYPSGHTVTNTVWAQVLGDLFPCKRQAFLARASAIGYHRVEAGAHFPFDIKGGQALGKEIYRVMRASEPYRSELAAVRAEARQIPVRCSEK